LIQIIWFKSTIKLSFKQEKSIILLWPQKSSKLMNKALESNHTVTCHKKREKWSKKLKRMNNNKGLKKLKKDIKVISFHKAVLTVNLNQMIWINKNLKNFIQILSNQWSNFVKKLDWRILKTTGSFLLRKKRRKKL